MVKEHSTIFRRIIIFADLIIIAISFFAGYFIRDQISELETMTYYLRFLPFIMVFLVSIFYALDIYESFGIRTILELICII